MDWKEMLLKLATSEQALLLYAAIVLFVYRELKQRQGWEDERWSGLITNAFLIAEKSKLLGDGKLQLALEIFNAEYRKTYNQPPSVTDMKDAALDLARKAYELKFAKAE
jgi:hypothetical protein